MRLIFFNFKTALFYLFKHLKNIENYYFDLDEIDLFLFELFLKEEKIDFKNKISSKKILIYRNKDSLIEVLFSKTKSRGAHLLINSPKKESFEKIETLLKKKVIESEENSLKESQEKLKDSLFNDKHFLIHKNESFSFKVNKIVTKIDALYRINDGRFNVFIINSNALNRSDYLSYLYLLSNKFDDILGIYSFSSDENYLLEGITNTNREILKFDKSLFDGESIFIKDLGLTKVEHKIRFSNLLFDDDFKKFEPKKYLSSFFKEKKEKKFKIKYEINSFLWKQYESL